MNNNNKITYQEFQKMLYDLDTPDEEIAKYINITQTEGGPFTPVLMPNPDMVSMTLEEVEAESAMKIGNGLARWRRQMQFKRRLLFGSKLPVIVAEGDSWHQFPVLIKEVVDHLCDDYLVWCVSAAGDTAQNMVFSQPGRGRREFMKALKKQKRRVKAFMFSAAGNDVIGEDSNGNPVLAKVLKSFDPNGDANAHIDHSAFADILSFLKSAYENVVQSVRAESRFERLPIIIHGYDYAIPGGFPGDPRNPSYAAKDEWLGKPMRDKNINDHNLQKAIIRILIDGLYDMLNQVASTDSHVHVVDVRGTLPDVSDWNDEIHGTSEGFKKITGKFKKKLQEINI